MANIRTVTIKNKIYSLKEFAEDFNASYTTVKRYYQKGLRNGKLLEAVKKASKHGMNINGVYYASGTQAAKATGIPASTLYKWAADNILEEKTKSLDNSVVEKVS